MSSAGREAGTVTRLLQRWSTGDSAAGDELFPLVYDELRRIARARMRREQPGLVLQPTALVHECYLRLAGRSLLGIESRGHFFALAGRVMRNVLVDHARGRRAAKRGGGAITVSIDEASPAGVENDLDVLALDRALTSLARVKPRHARIVELRFFAGLTAEEVADSIGISRATVERDWRFARAWLQDQLAGPPPAAS